MSTFKLDSTFPTSVLFHFLKVGNVLSIFQVGESILFPVTEYLVRRKGPGDYSFVHIQNEVKGQTIVLFRLFEMPWIREGRRRIVVWGNGHEAT